MTVQNILVVSTTGMGDCLWGTPGIRELKKAFPDTEIDLIVKKDWLDLFKHNTHLQNVYPYQNRWYAQILLGLKLLFKSKYSHIYIFHASLSPRHCSVIKTSKFALHHHVENHKVE